MHIEELIAWACANRKVASCVPQVFTVFAPRMTGARRGFVRWQTSDLSSSHRNWFPAEQISHLQQVAVVLLLSCCRNCPNSDLSTKSFELRKLQKENDVYTLWAHDYQAKKGNAPDIRWGTLSILHSLHLNPSNKGQGWKCKGGRWWIGALGFKDAFLNRWQCHSIPCKLLCTEYPQERRPALFLPMYGIHIEIGSNIQKLLWDYYFIFVLRK